MNTPNKLTIARVIMIPFFVAFLMYDITGAADKWIALVIFVAASLTDTLDGYLARKNNLVTNFGKFMDPLADKLLVCSALICFTAMGKLAAWITIVIIAREFIISGFRLVAADNGIVIAASYWGKFKNSISDDPDHSDDHGYPEYHLPDPDHGIPCDRCGPDHYFSGGLYCEEQKSIKHAGLSRKKENK